MLNVFSPPLPIYIYPSNLVFSMHHFIPLFVYASKMFPPNIVCQYDTHHLHRDTSHYTFRCVYTYIYVYVHVPMCVAVDKEQR